MIALRPRRETVQETPKAERGNAGVTGRFGMADEMLDYKHAAALTGIKVNTLYSMVARREIPHLRLGPRLVRFSRTELERWLQERSVPVHVGE